jgi:RimJ/RimL family protein N-acetyltransferase
VIRRAIGSARPVLMASNSSIVLTLNQGRLWMTVLTTERLRIRPLTAQDADWLIELHEDDEVSRFVGKYSSERAAHRLSADQEQWARRGYGLFAGELRSTGEAIGRFGLAWWEEFGETEIGWTLGRPHWGRGYATEASAAILDWGFGALGLSEITAMIAHGNDESTAVAERLGFTVQREEMVGTRPMTVHVLTPAVWAGTGRARRDGAVHE